MKSAKVKRAMRWLFYGIAAVLVLGLALAFIPVKSKVNHVGISPEEAADRRATFEGPHHLMKASDGETLFIRRWDPKPNDTAHKGTAILIFHGITAHSGAYAGAAEVFASHGYTTFGLDYRGHGLSGGNRADYPSKDRWVADLSEAIAFVKGLGFPKVVVLGHSLGVAAAVYAAKAVPDEISGLILLSGAYEARKGVRKSPSLFEKARIIASAVFRPSVQVVEYYREGMTGTDDPLFNFRYTLRFLRMLNVKELSIPENWDVPVLVAVGDKDELFEVDKVARLYDAVPSRNKEFLVLENTYHAKFPDGSWEKLVSWMDKSF